MLIVEDCGVTRGYITRVLGDVADMELLEPAVDGVEAVEKVVELEPDVVLMDLHLPRQSGLEAIEQIMSRRPRPVVVLSGQLSRQDVDYAFEALTAGAVDVIAKPQGMTQEIRREFAEELARTLRLMAGVKVITRRFPIRPRQAAPSGLETVSDVDSLKRTRIVAIGASTGGPAVLYEILSAIKAPGKVPILISQHIAHGFEFGLCNWLRTTKHDVVIAAAGDPIEPGKVYLSPADQSMVVTSRGLALVAALEREISPNIDRLFSSVARFYRERGAGVILTGMGRDGVRGLGELKSVGGWTIAQDEKSAVISSMPGEAADAGAAREVLGVAGIIRQLRQMIEDDGGES